MDMGVMPFRSGHSLTEFPSEERVERSIHDQVLHILSGCARCVSCSLVRVVGLLSTSTWLEVGGRNRSKVRVVV